MTKRLYSVREAAESLSLSTAQVYELCAKGELTKAYIGTGTRNFRIPSASLDEYVSRLNDEPKPAA